MTYNTYDAYASAVKLHIKPALGNYKLSALSPAAIQQWIDSLKAKGLSEQSIANYRGVLSGALKYAVYPCQYLRQNPCSYTRVPSVPVTQDQREHREYVCSSEAWSDIVDYFNGTCYYLPLMICYHTGISYLESVSGWICSMMWTSADTRFLSTVSCRKRINNGSIRIRSMILSGS